MPAAATVAALAERLPRADRIKNPVDLGVRAPLEDYLAAAGVLLDDDGVDAVIVVHAGRSGLEQADGLAALEAATAGAGKPVVACVVGPDGRLAEREEWTVPNYRFPEAAVRALALAADRRDWLSRPLGQRPVFDDVDAEGAQTIVAAALAELGPGWLDHERTAALLATHGLPVPATERCATVDAAVAAAERLGGPVALKADAPPPARAGDIDAVLLGLEGGDGVRAGWDELARRVAAAGREWAGVVVQPLVGAGADVLVGAVADPDLGPVVGVGMGGRQAGLAGDVAFRARARSPTWRSTTCSAARPACGPGSTARRRPARPAGPARRRPALLASPRNGAEVAEVTMCPRDGERGACARRARPHRAAAGAAARRRAAPAGRDPTCPGRR